MKTKTSILAVTKAFFILLVCCCAFISCRNVNHHVDGKIIMIDSIEYKIQWQQGWGNKYYFLEKKVYIKNGKQYVVWE